MEFTYIGEGIEAIVIDNFYTEAELKEIMDELKWLTKPSIMLKEDSLQSAQFPDGKYLTSKNGVFLEGVFRNWQHSALISHPLNKFKDQEFLETLFSYNPLFKIIMACDVRNHLLSYYENSGYYKSHVDQTVFTVLNYFHTDPKEYEGGDIVLSSYDHKRKATVESKHNRVVLISGNTPHEVTEIKSEHQDALTGRGRYCNAIFLHVNGDAPKKTNDSN